jgi:hypothetical protein
MASLDQMTVSCLKIKGFMQRRRIRLLIKKKNESILLVNYKFGRTYGEEFEV